MNNLLVIEKHGKPLTTSRKIAEVFSKDHDKVLRDIKNLDCSEEFSTANFGESNYGIRGKTYTEYLLTKDGFTFLVMGYRGKKAATFKEAYINQFNQMAEFIQSLQTAKLEFPAFTNAIMEAHQEPKHYHFSNECNMINSIVLGMTAKKFRELHNIEKGKSVRPHLNLEQIESIKTLQRIDIGLIVAVDDYQKRKTILEQQHGRLKIKGKIA